MKNKDMVYCGMIIILVIAAIAWAKRHPANPIRDTSTPPLPVNKRTNGNMNGNGMDVTSYKNFREQPYG